MPVPDHVDLVDLLPAAADLGDGWILAGSGPLVNEQDDLQDAIVKACPGVAILEPTDPDSVEGVYNHPDGPSGHIILSRAASPFSDAEATATFVDDLDGCRTTFDDGDYQYDVEISAWLDDERNERAVRIQIDILITIPESFDNAGIHPLSIYARVFDTDGVEAIVVTEDALELAEVTPVDETAVNRFADAAQESIEAGGAPR